MYFLFHLVHLLEWTMNISFICFFCLFTYFLLCSRFCYFLLCSRFTLNCLKSRHSVFVFNLSKLYDKSQRIFYHSQKLHTIFFILVACLPKMVNFTTLGIFKLLTRLSLKVARAVPKLRPDSIGLTG